MSPTIDATTAIRATKAVAFLGANGIQDSRIV
jgi:hypothetical protein